MKIQFLTGSNIAGATFQNNLKPLTVFVGKNRRGKTTRLRAITLALAGFCPDLPRKAGDIYAELATGVEMSVSVATDGGLGLARHWTKKRDSVKTTTSVNGFPDDFAVPPVLINADEFFGLSAKERVAYLFARTPSPLTLASICATITTNLKNIKLEEHTPEAEAVVNEILDEVGNLLSDMRDAELSVNEVVEKVFENVREFKKLADQNVKRMSGTTAGLAQVAGEEQAPPPADCEERLRQARGRLAGSQTESGRWSGTIRELERELDDLRKKAVAPDERAILAEIEELVRQRDLAARTVQPPEFNAGNVVPSADDAQTLNELSSKKQALFTASQQAEPDDRPASRKLEEVRGRRDAASRAANLATNEWNRLTHELEATASEKTCSKCGQSVVKLKEQVLVLLREKVEAANAKMTETGAALEMVEAEFKAAQKELSAVEAAHETYRRNVDEYRRVDNLHRIARENVVEKARRDHDQAVDSYLRSQRVVTARNESIAAMRARLEDKSSATAAAKIPEVETKLEQARQSHGQVITDVEGAQTEVQRLEQQVRQLGELRAAAAQRARVENESKLQVAKAEVLKLAVESLTALKAEMVKNAVEPLVQQMNAVIGDTLDGNRLAYDDGRLGFRVGSAFVERTMSGAEKAIVCCAVSVVLASESPLRLLMLDEVGRLDANTKLAFLETLARLINDGKIHQAVLADTSGLDYKQFAEIMTATGNDNFGIINV